MATLGMTGRVGLVVLLAAGLLVGMFTFFSGGGFFRHTYTLDVLFDNADGISTNAAVELAGVQIGQVQRVSLTKAQKADLTLEIKRKMNGQEVHIPVGSQFTISSAILGGTGIIMVVPPADAATRPPIEEGAADLVGTRTGDITASLAHANSLIDQLTATTRHVDVLLTDQKLQNNLQKTVENLNAASASGYQLTRKLNGVVETDNAQALRLLQEDNADAVRLLHADNAQVQQLLSQTQTGSKVALNNVVATTDQIKGMTTQNRQKINEIVANLNDTSAAVAGITQQTNDLLKNGGITKNLSATVANLKTTTDKLDAIAGSFQSLTTDPKVQGNLKATVQNIRDSSEQAELLLERLNRIAGGKRKTAAVVVGPGGAVVVPPSGGSDSGGGRSDSAPLFLPRVDLLQNTRDSHFRADVDAFVPLGATPGSFARAGIRGLGDVNKVNLEYGQSPGRQSLFDYRYGLYASKLSFGGDLGLNRRQTLSFDLYDPNRVHLDTHGVLMLSPELGLLIGAEDITRRSGPVVGLEYRHSK